MKKNILALTLMSLVAGTQVQAADTQSSLVRWGVSAVVTAAAVYGVYNWFNKPVDAVEVPVAAVDEKEQIKQKLIEKMSSEELEERRKALECRMTCSIHATTVHDSPVGGKTATQLNNEVKEQQQVLGSAAKVKPAVKPKTKSKPQTSDEKEQIKQKLIEKIRKKMSSEELEEKRKALEYRMTCRIHATTVHDFPVGGKTATQLNNEVKEQQQVLGSAAKVKPAVKPKTKSKPQTSNVKVQEVTRDDVQEILEDFIGDIRSELQEKADDIKDNKGQEQLFKEVSLYLDSVTNTKLKEAIKDKTNQEKVLIITGFITEGKKMIQPFNLSKTFEKNKPGNYDEEKRARMQADAEASVMQAQTIKSDEEESETALQKELKEKLRKRKTGHLIDKKTVQQPERQQGKVVASKPTSVKEKAAIWEQRS